MEKKSKIKNRIFAGFLAFTLMGCKPMLVKGEEQLVQEETQVELIDMFKVDYCGPEYAIYVSIIAGVLILFLAMDKITGIINLLKSISDKTYINKQFLGILLKITGIAIIAEFAVSICSDAGEKAIASKIEIGSKVIIIAISMPIISSLLELIIQILP